MLLFCANPNPECACGTNMTFEKLCLLFLWPLTGYMWCFTALCNIRRKHCCREVASAISARSKSVPVIVALPGVSLDANFAARATRLKCLILLSDRAFLDTKFCLNLLFHHGCCSSKKPLYFLFFYFFLQHCCKHTLSNTPPPSCPMLEYTHKIYALVTSLLPRWPWQSSHWRSASFQSLGSNRQHVVFRCVSLRTVYFMDTQWDHRVRLVGTRFNIPAFFFFFGFTEQRKKYSNSNYIMHETSQYHVEVRSAVFILNIILY